jgi:hypothetical protein
MALRGEWALVGTSCAIAIGAWYQHLHGLFRWIFGAMMTATVAAVVRCGGASRWCVAVAVLALAAAQ